MFEGTMSPVHATKVYKLSPARLPFQSICHICASFNLKLDFISAFSKGLSLLFFPFFSKIVHARASSQNEFKPRYYLLYPLVKQVTS